MPATSYRMGGPIPSRDWAETPEQREARLARERVLLAEARAQFENGEYFELDEVADWLDSDEDLPMPQLRRKAPKA